MQPGCPAAGLEAFPPTDVGHDIAVEVVLRTQRRVENVPCLGVADIREIPDGETAHREPAPVSLSTQEFLLYVGVATARSETRVIGECVVRMNKRRIVPVIHVVGEIVDVDEALE